LKGNPFNQSKQICSIQYEEEECDSNNQKQLAVKQAEAVVHQTPEAQNQPQDGDVDAVSLALVLLSTRFPSSLSLNLSVSLPRNEREFLNTIQQNQQN